MKGRNVITKSCIIKNNLVIINNQVEFQLDDSFHFSDFIKSIYNNYQINYPKFFKMDNISKLGFLTGELLLKGIDLSNYNKEDIGVVMANSSSSLDTDEKYFETIKNGSEFVFENFEADFICNYVNELMNSNKVQSCIAGWVDLYHDKYESMLFFIEKDKSANKAFISEHTSENIKNLYSNKI
jgi:hypothetical protein